MKKTSTGLGTILGAVLDVMIIIVGTSIFFWSGDPSTSRLWIPILFVLVGVLTLPKPDSGQGSVLASFVMMAIGLFLLARILGLVTIPLLRWGLGGSLVLIGSVDFLRRLLAKDQHQG